MSEEEMTITAADMAKIEVSEHKEPSFAAQPAEGATPEEIVGAPDVPPFGPYVTYWIVIVVPLTTVTRTLE